jgi:hypothetical protein
MAAPAVPEAGVRCGAGNPYRQGGDGCRKAGMKGLLVTLSLCAMFALALVTIHLRSREALLRYQIAELEMDEDLLIERLAYLQAELQKQTGVIGLLNKAVEFGIYLRLGGFDGNHFHLFTPLEEEAALE